MATRTIGVYDGGRQVTTREVEWPANADDPQEAMEALGYALQQGPGNFRGHAGPITTFALYSHPASSAHQRPDYAVWTDPYIYVAWPYAKFQPLDLPVFFTKLADVETYLHHVADPQWSMDDAWAAATLRYFLPVGAIVQVVEPGQQPWYGVIQSYGFGHMDPSGVWHPTSADVWHSDVAITQESETRKVIAATPRKGEPPAHVSYEYIHLPGFHQAGEKDDEGMATSGS